MYKVAANGCPPIEAIRLVQDHFSFFQRAIWTKRCAKQAVNIFDIGVGAQLIVRQYNDRMRQFLLEAVEEKYPTAAAC